MPSPVNPSGGSCQFPRNAARERQRAGQGVARGFDEAGLRRRAEPGPQRRSESAHQRQALRADAVDQPLCERVNMPRRKRHQFDGCGITLRRMRDNARRKSAEIGRPGARNPVQNRVRSLAELGKYAAQQWRPWHAPVPRPQHATQQFAAQPGAAALIRNRQPPAADPVNPALHDRPADRSGSRNDNAAVTAAVGTETRRVGVGRHNHALKRMGAPLRRRGMVRLTGAGHGQAGHHARHVALAQRRVAEALRGRVDDRGKAAREPEADICRPADGFCKHGSATAREPSPAARAATIHSQQQEMLIHLTLLQDDLFVSL